MNISNKGFIVLCTLSILFSCTSTKDMLNTTENQLLFSLKIFQSGKQVSINDNCYNLKREPFILQFVIDTGKTVYVNFSTTDRLYNQEKNNKHIEDELGFGGTGMAEYIGNAEKYIIITDSAWHVWSSEIENTRFNNLKKENGKIIGERIVENVYNTNSNENTLSQQKLLYMVFCDVKYANRKYIINKAEAAKLQFE